MKAPDKTMPIAGFVPDLCEPRRLLVVVLAAQMMAVLLTLAGTYYDGFSFGRLALISFFMQWVALTATGLLCLMRHRLNRLHPAWGACAVVVVVVGTTLIYSALSEVLLARIVPSFQRTRDLWGGHLWVNVTMAAIMTSTVMRYFYVSEQLRAEEKIALQSRIQALQSRIRPHFLFNSMNIIASLIAVDPDAAELAVEDLSRLFRASLRESGAQVSLEEELDLCRRYVRIEQLRMGARLQMRWEVDIDPKTALIPLLTLQPLLENAIYHGIQPRPDGGEVVLRVGASGTELVYQLINPLPLGKVNSSAGNRMALDNIRQRLAALYGKRARLDVDADNNEYRVTLRYPRT